METILDRLTRLIQSWGRKDAGNPGSTTGYEDPDLRRAEAELDEYLNAGKSASQDFARWEASAPQDLERAFLLLELPYMAPWEEVKAAYKRLLVLLHPDKHAASPGAMERATEMTQRVNEAYQKIKTAYKQ